MRALTIAMTTTLILAVSPATVMGGAAHVHGEAELTVAVEGNKVQVELLAPADSLLGFEHKPRTAAQEKALSELKHKFESEAQSLIAAPKASECGYEMRVFVAFGDDGHEAHRKMGHGASHADHGGAHIHHSKTEETATKDSEGTPETRATKTGHSHHAHAKHDHNHEQGSRDQASNEAVQSEHSDIHVVYLISCKKSLARTKLEINLIKAFPRIEKLKVQVLSESKQAAQTFKEKSFTVEL